MSWFNAIKEESKFTPENLSEAKRKLFESEPSFKVDFPDYEHPDNEEELPKVLAIMKKKEIDEDEIKDLDQNNNEMMLKIVGEEKEDREDLIEDIDIHTIKLKVKYGRPRPYEISDEIESTTDTDDSPSFPSGHAIEAHALAKILGKQYPDKQEELNKMAEKISLSRVQMGNHYPSDIEVGKEAGLLIADTYLSESKIEKWQDILHKKRKSKYKAPPGVYTNPKLRERIHATLLNQNTHGTGKGKWSARKSQELNRRYKKAGGGFVN